MILLKMKKIKKIMVLFVLLLVLFIFACTKNGNKVVIYTSLEDYRIARLQQLLNDEFKDFKVVVEYYNTGNHAAKLMAEGINTECDITINLDFGHMEQLSNAGILADVSSYKTNEYIDEVNVSNNYIVQERNGCAIAINPDYLSRNNIKEPKTYNDLLKEEYKGLIAMPNPVTSDTGYGFYKSFVNVWGETKALNYIKELSNNIVEFTSSGNAPLNMMKQNEIAIGFGMTASIVTTINDGYNFKILIFEEGSPYTFKGQGIIKGKENRKEVKKVFEYLVNTYNRINNTEFFPEQIYKDYLPIIKNFPTDIKYADMSNNTYEEKEKLLAKWTSVIG